MADVKLPRLDENDKLPEKYMPQSVADVATALGNAKTIDDALMTEVAADSTSAFAGQLSNTNAEMLPPMVASALADNPAVVDAAVAKAQTDAGLVRRTDAGARRPLSSDAGRKNPILNADRRLVGYERPDGTQYLTGLEVGELTQGNVRRFVVPAATAAPTVRVDADFRIDEPGAGPDGLTDPAIIRRWEKGRGVTPGIFETLVGLGDSMTTDYATTGTSQTVLSAAKLGVTPIDLGLSGEMPLEIAYRVGAIPLYLTVAGGSVPASGSVAVTLNRSDGWRTGHTRSYRGVVYDRSDVARTVILAKDASDVFTLSQVGGTGTITIPTEARFIPDHGAYMRLPMKVWIGRNDVNTARVSEALTAIIAAHHDPYGRLLVSPIFNGQNEPSGSSGYTSVMAVNTAAKDIAGRRWFDFRREMVQHSLEIAGVTATSDDTTAISEDRIPPRFFADTLHLNVLGKTTLAVVDARAMRGDRWNG